MNKEQEEIIEEAGIVGPGFVLAQARIQQDLSIEHVASKLNFRVILVKNIEADIYDKTLPDTYNRGYLKNYAKLVGIPIQDVIASYEKLNVLQENTTKMQSFSRGTMKEAQNSLLMWVTYLILAVFIGLTVLWWMQDSGQSDDNVKSTPTSKIEAPAKSNSPILEKKTLGVEQPKIAENPTVAISTADKVESDTVGSEPLDNESELNEVNELDEISSVKITEEAAPITENVASDNIVTSVFTFSGDCWVNIYDADGERVAWGIKKSGYVMTISGKAPFNITIGKPELVEISLDGESVDMSTFRQGHIAKFTLPIVSQS